MSSAYFAILTNPPTELILNQVAYLDTTIFVADARNNIFFYTDNNFLRTQPLKRGTANNYRANFITTIISISLDDVLKIIVVGSTTAIYVMAYDNSQLIAQPRYTLTNSWDLDYRLFFDPIFFRVIIDFDISWDESSHYLVDWVLLN